MSSERIGRAVLARKGDMEARGKRVIMEGVRKRKTTDRKVTEQNLRSDENNRAREC